MHLLIIHKCTKVKINETLHDKGITALSIVNLTAEMKNETKKRALSMIHAALSVACIFRGRVALAGSARGARAHHRDMCVKETNIGEKFANLGAVRLELGLSELFILLRGLCL